MPTTAPAPTDVLEKVETLGPPGTPVTTPEVAEGFDCTQRTIYNKLESLVDDGVLETKKVGANSRVWWRPVEHLSRDSEAQQGQEQIRSHPVFDSDLIGVIVWGEDLRIRDANDAFLEMAGLEYEDAVGTSWRDLTPAEFHSVSERQIEQFEETGRVAPYEKQYYHTDGSRWWGVFDSKELNDDGSIEFVIDITERKEAEKSLKETNEQLTVALEAGEMGTWEWDLKARTGTGDEQFRRLWDLPRSGGPIPVEEFLTRMDPESAADIEAVMDTAFEPGEKIRGEVRLDDIPNGPRWINLLARATEADPSILVGVSFDITEQKQRTRALEERTAELEETRTRLKIAAEAGSVGLYTVDVDEDRLIGDRYVADCYDVDPDRAADGAPVDEFVAAVLDDDTERVLREFEAALTETGRLDTEYRVRNGDGDVVWLISRGIVEYDDSGTPRKLHGAISDISEQKDRERREQFLVALGDAIRPLSDPVEIQCEAARITGEELHLDRAHYGEVLEDENTNIIHTDYYRGDVSSIAGRHTLDGYGSYIGEAFRAGDTVVIDDFSTIDELSDEERAIYDEVEITAWIGVPLVKDDRLVAYFVVNNSTAREWTETEVEMVEETAQRTWEAVERAHTEHDLRESEERYRTLFESIDQGFCIIEVVFDEDDEPVDYRFLETNPAFESQTGLTDAEGELMRELEPNHEEHWFEIYGRITRTGEAERFQNEAKYLGDRWYDVYAFPIGEPEERKVAILFDDVSEARHTQQALERLTVTSRELINADTETVRARAAELVVDVLDVEYAALWRYDEVTGDLTEATSALDVEAGTDAVSYPDDASEQIWQAFIGDDITVTHDLSVDGTDSDGVPLRSRLLVPLGRHGVICVGSVEPNVFDERVVDLAETLGATIETAWNRAESERRLQTQNEELQRLDQLNRLIREIDQALVGAGTREGIDDAVCELLASSELYESAWLATYDAETDTLRPQAWAGVDSGYLDNRIVTLGETSSDDPLVTAYRSREMQIVSHIATDARVSGWREVALERGARSCVTIPLVYEESMYGILTVYGRTPHPEERETDVLEELGRNIAHAIHALEASTTRRTDSVVELTLQTTMAETPLVRLARELDCEIEFEGLVPGTGGDTTVFFTARGVSQEELVAAGEQLLAIEDLQHVADRETGALFRAQVTEESLPVQFLERGATIQSLRIDAGAATAVVELPETAVVREFVESLRGDLSDLDLLSRRIRTQEPEASLQSTVLDRLTPRQQEVLQLAYRSGYFEMPRIQTGEELADVLGIVPSTFAKHIRSAERNVLDVVFATEHEPPGTEAN